MCAILVAVSNFNIFLPSATSRYRVYILSQHLLQCSGEGSNDKIPVPILGSLVLFSLKKIATNACSLAQVYQYLTLLYIDKINSGYKTVENLYIFYSRLTDIVSSA